jgi:hypothetical protein
MNRKESKGIALKSGNMGYWRKAVTVGLGVLAAAVCVGLASAASPPVDSLEVGQALPRASLLTAGVHRYARYMISDDSRSLIDVWSRRLSYEDLNGRQVLHIHQRWDAADKSYVAIFDQIFEAKTFRPLSQTRSVTRNGATKTLSVTVDGPKVDSISDGGNGTANALHENFSMPFYNFHTDMELLQALPLKKGYVASIPFYDVAQEPPARYTYRVVGGETLPGAGGALIECWLVLYQSSDLKSAPIRFWFAKRNQVLVREEATVPGQGTLVKTLLNAEAEDGAG